MGLGGQGGKSVPGTGCRSRIGCARQSEPSSTALGRLLFKKKNDILMASSCNRALAFSELKILTSRSESDRRMAAYEKGREKRVGAQKPLNLNYEMRKQKNEDQFFFFSRYVS